MSGKRQGGFALVAAVFIIVVLAMLGIMMVTIGGMQRATASAAVQGARAYHAAHAGVEWGIFQALAGGCAAATAAPPGFALMAPGLDGFNVSVTCTSTQHREHSDLYFVFVITSTATSGNFGAADYASRRIQVTVTDAPPP
jgi:MSHA biogenesis protein MshP